MTDHHEDPPQTPPPARYAMVRIFCLMDGETIQSRAGLAYCQALFDLGVAFRPLAHGAAHVAPNGKGIEINPWSRFTGQMLTPLTSPYVTLVCTPPEHWYRYITPRKVKDFDTGCLRNVLITNTPERDANISKRYNVVLNNTTFLPKTPTGGQGIVVDPRLRDAVSL